MKTGHLGKVQAAAGLHLSSPVNHHGESLVSPVRYSFDGQMSFKFSSTQLKCKLSQWLFNVIFHVSSHDGCNVKIVHFPPRLFLNI